jgi:hypothetical protein
LPGRAIAFSRNGAVATSGPNRRCERLITPAAIKRVPIGAKFDIRALTTPAILTDWKLDE